MSIQDVLLRFFLYYNVLIIVAGMVMNYFNIGGSDAVNIGILAGCITWLCSVFGKKNGRYFTGNEKTAVVLGFVAIDLFSQFFFGAMALIQSQVKVTAGALLFAVGFVGLLHAVFIYFFVSLTKKTLIKQGIISG